MTEAEASFRIQHTSLQAAALTRLRNDIVAGVFKPGERLQERLLCERFGISRSPLREAYQTLAAEGFLDLLRNRGAVVSAPTLEDVLQNHVLLTALETLSIGLACDVATDDEIAAIVARHEDEVAAVAAARDAEAFRLNNELHRKIVEASHNRPVIDAHLIVQRRLIRVQNVNGVADPEKAPPASEHEPFISALQRRDKLAAVRGMAAHLDHITENLKVRLAVLKPQSALLLQARS